MNSRRTLNEFLVLTENVHNVQKDMAQIRVQNDIEQRNYRCSVRRLLSTHAAIAGEGILPKESFALLEQIHTIDRMRLREWVGCLGAQEMVKINQALMISVGLNQAFF